MKHIYIVGGTMGVGKTAVCKELKTRIHTSVFLDGDWCWDANPFQVTDETKFMVMDNISHLLNNFIKCSAYENVIFCWVMHQQSIIDELMSKIDITDCKVINVSLIATERTLREHIERDIAEGKRSQDVLKRSVERIGLYGALDTVKISVDGKNVSDIATEILSLRNP